VSQITPIFVSVKQAAQMLNLTTWSVYKLLDEQAIESRYHGRRRLVSVESVRAYAEALPTEPESA
jgi:excisionase family DNA binding protein